MTSRAVDVSPHTGDTGDFFCRSLPKSGLDKIVTDRRENPGHIYCQQGCPLLQPKPVPGKYGVSIDTLGIYLDIT